MRTNVPINNDPALLRICSTIMRRDVLVARIASHSFRRIARNQHLANSALLFIYFNILNIGAMTKMASIEVNDSGRYIRGMAIVFGIIVVFAFAMILLAAAPGKEMLNAHGANDSNPMSSLANVYSRDNVQCAFGAMSCNLFR